MFVDTDTRIKPLHINMAPKYKLTYFAFKGLGEPIRYLLSYGGTEFEDVRIDFKTWTSSVKQKTPFGKVPILEIDGKVLSQCKAICRYLGKQVGLSGKDDWENLQIDIMADTVDDLRSAVVNYYFDPDEESRAQKEGPVLNETLPFYLKKLDAVVGGNNGFVANKKLSWADIYCVGILEHICFLLERDVLTSHPHLKALKETVHANPNIKKYIAKRPAALPLVMK